MARTQRGIIDELTDYTVYDPAPGATPADDYFLYGNYTVWGVGLITFGAPTAQQIAWMSTITTNSNLATFPGDWILFYSSVLPYNPGPIEVWGGGTKIGGALLNEQAVRGITSWSIGGMSGTGAFFWSDLHPINGTPSSETITGTSIAETINGGDGNDVINGGDGADALFGGPGNDRLIGGLGVDRLFGGTGDDWLEPGTELPATSYNFAADTQIDGGAGFDILALDHSASARSVSLTGSAELSRPGVTNVEAVALTGSAFADVLIGTANSDQLFGGGGFDYLDGSAGNDLLDAGAPSASSVTTLGQGGMSAASAVSLDHLFAAGSNGPFVSLSISQPAGAAVSFGAQAQGSFYSFTVAAAGDQMSIAYQVFDYNSDYFFDFIIKDSNGVQVETMPFNQPVIFPHAGIYTLQVTLARGNYWGSSSIDVTLTLQGGTSLTSNELVGGLGDDTYRVYASTDQVIELAGQGTDTVESTASFTLSANVENLRLVGSSAIDGIGNTLANTILGNSAANTLTGNDGDDLIVGGAGNDQINGGAGFDTIDYSQESGGNGVVINLGPSTGLFPPDPFPLGPGSARDTFGNTDTLTSVEHIITGSGNDVVIGNAAAIEIIETGAGNDSLGGGGGDTLIGGAGNDSYGFSPGDIIIELANGGIDAVNTSLSTFSLANIANVENINGAVNTGQTLIGNALDNLINAASGNDNLFGGAGDDRLSPGLGVDSLTGGSGNDTFTGQAASLNGDTITDFTRGDRLVINNAAPGQTLGWSNGQLTYGSTSITLTNLSNASITAAAAPQGGVQIFFGGPAIVVAGGSSATAAQSLETRKLGSPLYAIAESSTPSAAIASSDLSRARSHDDWRAPDPFVETVGYLSTYVSPNWLVQDPFLPLS